MSHPVLGLNDVVHQRSRLAMLAILHETGRIEFGALRTALGFSEGNLSRHLRALEEAGYVAIEKGYVGKRPRTWIHSTAAGEDAFAGELQVLRDLVARVDALGNASSEDKAAATAQDPTLEASA